MNFLVGLWGLVNNAGWATFGEVEWVSMDNYKKAMEINLHGVILGRSIILVVLKTSKLLVYVLI